MKLPPQLGSVRPAVVLAPFWKRQTDKNPAASCDCSFSCLLAQPVRPILPVLLPVSRISDLAISPSKTPPSSQLKCVPLSAAYRIVSAAAWAGLPRAVKWRCCLAGSCSSLAFPTFFEDFTCLCTAFKDNNYSSGCPPSCIPLAVGCLI